MISKWQRLLVLWDVHLTTFQHMPVVLQIHLMVTNQM